MSPAAAPAGASVIVVHGLCSTSDEMLSVLTGLRLAGHEVLPLAIEGYTYDPALQRQRSTCHQEWLRAVGQAVHRAAGRGRRVVIAGLSSGASLSLGALIDPEVAARVDGVVLMSTSLRLDGWAMPWHRFLMPLALYTPLGRFWRYHESPPYGVKNPRVRNWVARELAERNISRAGAAVIEIAHLRENDRLRRRVGRMLTQLTCRSVLALHALEDEIASPANVALLERRLRAGSFRSVLLRNSYHMITIDNDRQEVVRETVRYVDALVHGPAVIPSPQPVSEMHHDSVNL